MKETYHSFLISLNISNSSSWSNLSDVTSVRSIISDLNSHLMSALLLFINSQLLDPELNKPFVKSTLLLFFGQCELTLSLVMFLAFINLSVGKLFLASTVLLIYCSIMDLGDFAGGGAWTGGSITVKSSCLQRSSRLVVARSKITRPPLPTRRRAKPIHLWGWANDVSVYRYRRSANPFSSDGHHGQLPSPFEIG